MRCSRRLWNYQLQTWGATSLHGSGFGLEGQAHFKQIHFNNAKYKQWKLIHPITVWTHILQPFKYQRDVVANWVNDLSDVAFVAGMLRMNCRSATTCDISNRWLAEWQKVLFRVKDIHCSICSHNIEINAQHQQLDANVFFVEFRVIQMANDVQILGMMPLQRHRCVLST